jgi:hypothetical protein
MSIEMRPWRQRLDRLAQVIDIQFAIIFVAVGAVLACAGADFSV